MASTSSPLILICARDPAELRSLLEGAGHAVQVRSLTGEDAELPRCGLVVVDGKGQSAEAMAFCRRLRSRMVDAFVPVLFVLDDPSPTARLACLEAGVDSYLLRPFVPGELLAQVQAFLRIKQMHGRLADQTAEMRSINQRLKRAYQQIDLELEAARRLQMSFLPQTLPEVGGVRFAVHYRPCGRVGGDFYDVFRLDEDHVGFYIADAMGHGVPASLLTIFLKRGVRGKSIHGCDYRLVPPREVLARLNRELIGQQLPEMPFITMLYALLNCRDGTLRFARAGHPYPLYVPREGEPALWMGHAGGLLGVFVTEYRDQEQQLRPGDKLLLYTDGLDTGGSDSGGETKRLLWDSAQQHRSLPIHEHVPRVAAEVLAQVKQADDFTLLGVEMGST
jgi:sigma-B regulation protein RsbU (phosphoserine phosphatase)